MAGEYPVWAGADGLPTRHVARAALHVAALLDSGGSRIVDARESYWQRATGGSHHPADLERGERLLVDCGLAVEREDSLYPTTTLDALLDGSAEDAMVVLALRGYEAFAATSVVPPEAPSLAEDVDPERRELLLLALQQRFDDAHRRLIGEIGEEVIVAACRLELTDLGYAGLARDVRRVSLESDALGYDVWAPRVNAGPRRLEVKSLTVAGEQLRVHLSRNEAEKGLQFESWALVICQVISVEARTGQVLGWCPASALNASLPHDTETGRWEQALLTIQASTLFPGLPEPFC